MYIFYRLSLLVTLLGGVGTPLLGMETVKKLASQQVDDCSICLETLALGNIELLCSHKLHRSCLKQYLSSNNNARCTLCRAQISSEVRQQLQSVVTCDELVGQLMSYCWHLLIQYDVEQLQKTLTTIIYCDEEIALLRSALDISEEQLLIRSQDWKALLKVFQRRIIPNFLKSGHHFLLLILCIFLKILYWHIR